MTTMIVNIENSANIKNIVATVRQLKGVSEVMLQSEEEFEAIAGLPYTHEERMADICRAEDDYRMKRTTTSEELKKRVALW